MNIMDLQRINIEDLGKINYLKLAQNLRSRPEILAMTVAVALSALFCITSFNKFQKESARLRTEQTQMEEKISQLTRYTQTQAALEKYLDQIPPSLTESQFVEIVTNFANQDTIKIVSLNPKNGGSTTYADSIQLDLQITAPRYASVWSFIYEMEHTAYAIRVDSWSGAMDPSQPNAVDPDTESGISARLVLTVVNLKKT